MKQIQKMSKGTSKVGFTQSTRIYYNTPVVEKVAENLNVTAYYVRKALKGNAKSETADNIRKEYNRLILQVDKALNDKR